MVELAVLLPYYNDADRLRDGSLDCFLRLQRELDIEVKIVVLDDNSTDETLELLLGHAGSVDVLSHRKNTDYCGAMNDLLRYVRQVYNPAYYLLGSQDSTISPEAVGRLVDLASAHPRLGILQPLAYDAHGGVYSYGHAYNDYYMCQPIRRDHAVWPTRPRDGLLDRPSVSFVCTLVRSEVFEQVGVFDERFEHYWETSDISFRAWESGWTVAATDGATVEVDNVIGDAAPEHVYMVYRNWPLFWTKYYKPVAERILSEFWSQQLLDVDWPHHIPARTDRFRALARARRDAYRLRSEFERQVQFSIDEPLPDRAIVTH